MGLAKVEKIGKYVVLSVLGKGGMGVVYKASDTSIGRLVAIKMITTNFADDANFLKRFYREAQSTGKLQHQNIVIVHELGDLDGSPFLVMEYLEGESLESIIASRRQVPLIEKLDYIIQACNGLQYAHQRNPAVVHRDIKPGNLMVLDNGQVKIVDFGIAHVENENMTLQGQFLGSLQYMSPEQINCLPVDCRTDVFSTGVVLYQLLTNVLPFQGKDTGSSLLKIINEPPPNLQNYLREYPPELDEILLRALAKKPDERYQTAEEFASDLFQVQEKIKDEAVSELLVVAQDLIKRSELSQATEEVQQILKIDRQNSRGRELLREIQRLKASQQRSEQARQIRVQAEQALNDKQFARALAYLNQAVALDPANTELVAERDSVRDSAEREEKIHEALKRAESARWAGDLTQALEAVDEAVAVDSTASEAKTLREQIAREIETRNRQMELQGFLGEAGRQISSRHFTAALEILQKAEALDPVAPAVRELKSLATMGREQEHRRNELERFSSEIKEALNSSDYLVASDKLDEALKSFPEDRSLLKLKALVEKQRQAGEKRTFIDAQISIARKSLENGRTEDALHTLEAACERYPHEPALVSLLTAVKENLEQEQTEARKNDYLEKAQEALRLKNFDEAIAILSAGRDELHAPELEDLLQFAHEESLAFSKRKIVEAAAEEAHRLMSAEQYQEAIEFLSATLQEESDEELEILLAEARQHVEDFQRRVKEAIETGGRLLQSNRITEAVRFLESQTGGLQRSPEFLQILETARQQQERNLAISTAVQRARAAIENRGFDLALQEVNDTRKRFGDSDELKKVEAEVEARRREAAVVAVRGATTNARTLFLGGSYLTALEMLERVEPMLEFVPEDLRQSYRTMRDEAKLGLDRQAKVAELQELNQLVRESETTTEFAELRVLSQRARNIAERHPGDPDIESIATEIADRAVTLELGLGSGAQVEAPPPAAEMPRRPSATVIPAQAPPVIPEPVVPEPMTATVIGSAADVAPDVSEVSSGAAAEVSSGTVAPSGPHTTSWAELTPLPEVKPVAAETPREPKKPPYVPEPPPPPKPGVSKLIYVVVALLIVAGGIFAGWKFWSRPPVVDSATIHVTTEPAGATVEADGKSCVTPDCNLLLKFGEHQLKASLPGYAAVSRTVQVSSDSAALPISLSLQPLGNTLRLSTNFGSGRVTFDGQPLGELTSGQFVLDNVKAGDHSIALSSPDGRAELGFATATARMPAVQGPVRAQNVSALVVTNLGGNTRAHCNCTQPTPIAVDGKTIGDLTPDGRDLGNLGEGNHEFRIGQDKTAHTYVVKIGAQPALNMFVDSDRDVGILVVQTGVEDAAVYLDGRRFGRTAKDGTLRAPLPVKDIVVRVEKPGYKPTSAQTAQLAKNHETGLTFDLQPLPSKSFLAIADVMPDTSVIVDGKAVGAVNEAGRFTREVSPGQHTIELSKNGYKTAKQVHNFDLGATFVMGGALEPVAAPKSYLAIEGAIPDSSVILDGEAVGAVRDNGRFEKELAPGQHKVNVTKDGYKPAEWNHNFANGETFKLRASMQPAEAPAKQSKTETPHPLDPNDVAVLTGKKKGADAATTMASAAPKPADTPPAATDVANEKLKQRQLEEDRNAVLRTLKRYSMAYQHRSADEVESIWPSLPKPDRKKISESFKNADAIMMDLKPIGSPEISGDSASVQCNRNLQFTFGGKDQAVKDVVTIKLLKKDDTWFIDSIS